MSAEPGVPLPAVSIRDYLDTLLTDIPEEEIFIDRKLILDDKWRERASDNVFRYAGILREYEPDLAKVLAQQRAVVVGEPGSGKSTIARVAVRQFALQRSPASVPVLVNLRSYRGSLTAVLRQQVPPAILESPDITRKYVLDAIDEVPREYLAQFGRDLGTLLQHDNGAGCFITSRQAFFAEHRNQIGFDAPVFHLIDFDEEDLRQYSRRRGLDPQQFLDAVYEAEISSEVANPFIAKITTERMLQNRPLSKLRSENIGFMVEQLLAVRPLSEPLRSRRAVQLLAVGMETYARNELTIDEAVQILIAGLGLLPAKASELVDELLQSILIRTPGGISFQLHSYGEFLAAAELQNQPFDHIRRLAFFDDGTPNDSWTNAISLLAEMHGDVRRYFTRNYPEWMTLSSPFAFTEDERTSVVEGLVSALDSAGQFLLGHPTISARKVVRFLTDRNVAHLTRDLDSARPEVQGNAFVLLGMAEKPEVVPHALGLAKAVGRADNLRYSAIVALLNSSRPDLIDELIPVLDRKDPYHDLVLECIGTLMTEDDFGRVMPLLLTTNTMLSAVFTHVRGLRTRPAVVNVLRLLIASPDILRQIRAEAYLEPAIKAIPDHCDEEIVKLLANLFLVIESKAIFDTGGLFQKIVQGIESAGCQRGVCEAVLQDFIIQGGVPRVNNGLLASWIDKDMANLLIGSGATELIQRLSPYIQPGEIRDTLAPHSGGFIPAQDENTDRYLAERAQRAAAEAEKLATKQTTALESDAFNSVLGVLYELNEESWPTLTVERKNWLSAQTSARLGALDLEHSIARLEGTSWTQPSELSTLLKIIDHYALRIERDDQLVLALRAWPESAISNYFTRYGFSEAARQQFEALIADPNQHPIVVDNLVLFLMRTDYEWPNLQEILLEIAKSTRFQGYVQVNAVEVLGKHNAPDDTLIGLLGSHNRGVKETAFNLLIARQHRATIERELSHLINDSAALRAGEVPLPEVTRYNWIGKITSDWAWYKLKALRRQTLLLELPYICGTVTETMRKLNPQELPNVVGEQIRDCPATWAQSQKKLLLDYRRQARLLSARQTPFARVLAKLKVSTSIVALKVWVEGTTDLPIFRKLLNEMGLTELAETLDVVGGWSMLLTRPPQRWSDGCREALIVMDGDVGRQLRKRGKPYTQEAKRAFERLRNVPANLYVLERYGIENYFTRAAMEKILQRDLSAYYPIPDDLGIERHLIERQGIIVKILLLMRKWFGITLTIERGSFYRKSYSEAVAENMTLRDIHGTDLEQVLQAIKIRQEELVG